METLVKAFNDFAFEFDADGIFLNFWTSSDALRGHVEKELLGRHAHEALDNEVFRPFHEIFRRVTRTGKSEDLEYLVDLPEGRRWFQARVSPVPRSGGPANTVCLVARDITERKRIEEELHRVTQQLLHTRDEERRRMSRELHERAAQSVAALKMTLKNLAEIVPDDDERGQALLKASLELADDAMQEVRTISYLLHPPILDEAGLASALRWYAAGFSERSGIVVSVEITEGFGRLPQEVETSVFRIVQEALANVHRHSGSRTAVIRAVREEGMIRAEVQDQGCGMALPSAATGWHAPLGIGIAGMRERVRQLNGVFDVLSAPGRGTTIRVLLPVGQTRAPQGGRSTPHNS